MGLEVALEDVEEPVPLQVLFKGTHDPHGAAKHKNHVDYDDNADSSKITGKADPSSFKSLGEGHFRLDDEFVFCGHATIAKADRQSRRQVDGFDSMDRSRVFYLKREILDADRDAFRVVRAGPGAPCAGDARHMDRGDRIIDGDAAALLRSGPGAS